MDILTWSIAGLVAGVLVSLVVGSAGGLIVDIVVGIVGAFIGGILFREAGWAGPVSGIAGTIFVAFIGAMILLVIIRLVWGASSLFPRRPSPRRHEAPTRKMATAGPASRI